MAETTTFLLRMKQFWRERVLALILAQFRQGITPPKVAFTISLAFNIGVFPIIGATMLICLLVGFLLKLNQPLLFFVNSLTVAVQAPLVLVFVRIGESILHAPHVSFSIPELFRKFHESPVNFMREFWLTGWHGIFAWLLIAPFTTALLFLILLPPLNKLARAFSGVKRSSSRAPS